MTKFSYRLPLLTLIKMHHVLHPLPLPASSLHGDWPQKLLHILVPLPMWCLRSHIPSGATALSSDPGPGRASQSRSCLCPSGWQRSAHSHCCLWEMLVEHRAVSGMWHKLCPWDHGPREQRAIKKKTEWETSKAHQSRHIQANHLYTHKQIIYKFYFKTWNGILHLSDRHFNDTLHISLFLLC